jgi:Leucine-rich repeat (LRR) protein
MEIIDGLKVHLLFFSMGILKMANNLPIEIIINLFKEANIDDLLELKHSSSQFLRIWNTYEDDICRYLLAKYKVQWKDRSCIIYTEMDTTENLGDLSPIIHGPKEALEYYIDFYNRTEIDIRDAGIGSIPILPKLEILECGGNELKSLPMLPNLIKLYCENNELTTLPSYPKLEFLDCSHNLLTALPEYPKLEVLDCSDNKIVELPDYPLLEDLTAFGNPFFGRPEDDFDEVEDDDIESDIEDENMIGNGKSGNLRVL